LSLSLEFPNLHPQSSSVPLGDEEIPFLHM
jgi:hypothetical protein